MTDGWQAAGSEPTFQDLAGLYARAHLRGMKFSHFSASRHDTRAQLHRWLLREQVVPREIQENRAPAPPPPSPRSSALPPDAGPGIAREIPPRSAERERREEEPHVDPTPLWLSPLEETFEGETLGEGTLAEAAERVSSRWLLLNEVFPPRDETVRRAQSGSRGGHDERIAPIALVFSIAGGVGKTTLLATLGRALAAHGERILLADAAPFGIVPCYFGAQVARPGLGSERGPAPSSVRTFSPPKGSNDLPLDLLTLDAGGQPREGGQDPLREALLRNGRKAHRILVDIQTASKTVAERLLSLRPLVLVPLLPDMNSVASLTMVEEALAGCDDSGGGSVKILYLLNQFDSSLPLHLDVREVLDRQLGDRLLPFVMRRSPAVSEALAEGMTVMDYAPGSSAAEDYARLADWLHRAAPPASRGLEQLRWSEG